MSGIVTEVDINQAGVVYTYVFIDDQSCLIIYQTDQGLLSIAYLLDRPRLEALARNAKEMLLYSVQFIGVDILFVVPLNE